MTIKDYDYMIRIDNHLNKISDNPEVFSEEFLLSSYPQQHIKISVDITTNLYTVAIVGDEKNAVTFPIIDIMLEARKKSNDNSTVVIADKSNDELKVKLIITYIYAEIF